MSNVTYTFYTSRTAARAAVVPGLKFKDHGPDAAKGERWSTFSLVASKPTLRTAAKSTGKKRTPRTNSKKTEAVALITKMLEKGADRPAILSKLVEKVGLTAPGASTYYANTKNGASGWTL